MILGFLGFIFYAMEEISMMFATTHVIILRIFVLVFYFCIQACLLYLILKPRENEIENIKNIVIDMSDKFTITTIKEVSEKSMSDHNIMINIINRLITNGDLNAEFFRRSKKIAFYK